MSNGDDLGALSRSAGFVRGFTGSLLSTVEKREAAQAAAAEKGRERGADRAKWEAYNQLQRDLHGKKTLNGQELIDYGRGLNVPEHILAAAFQPGREYESDAARAWITQVGTLQRPVRPAAGSNTPIPMDKYIAAAELRAKSLAGIPAAVAPGDPSLDPATQERFDYFFQNTLGGMINSWEQTTGRSAGTEAGNPLEVDPVWGGWRKSKIKPGPVIKPRGAPGPTAVPTAAPAAAPRMAPTAGPTPGPKQLRLQDLPRD